MHWVVRSKVRVLIPKRKSVSVDRVCQEGSNSRLRVSVVDISKRRVRNANRTKWGYVSRR